MKDIQQLNRTFAIPKQLEIVAGPNGWPMIKIGNHSASALISLYGAQIVSFQPHDQVEDLLFLSKKSSYTEGQAIRGGIPVCWPWFGPDPKGLQRANHGFVRQHFWQLVETTAIDSATTRVRLQFDNTLKQESTWRQAFQLSLEITVSQALSLKLTTINTGEQAFSITQAFHSYFRVGHIEAVQVLGLEGCEYFDKLEQGAQKTQHDTVVVTQEVDRIYTGVSTDLMLVDPLLQRRLRIHAPNTSTAVVWNPWAKTARKMPDLGNNDYRNFICVEAGNVAFELIQIQPGNQHCLQADYQLLPL